MATATAGENVAIPSVYAGLPKSQRISHAHELLQRLGLGDRTDHRPSELSGGQQQRVAIARALVNQPSLLLADEPTGNLDSQTSIEIMGVFQKLNEQGITIIMVTHELDIARYTKRNVILRDGQIVTDEAVRSRLAADVELNRLREAQQAVKLA
jgi:putative ABC transport system ATP-binding protein